MRLAVYARRERARLVWQAMSGPACVHVARAAGHMFERVTGTAQQLAISSNQERSESPPKSSR